MATGLAEGTREARNFLGAHARRRKSSEQFRWGEGSGIGLTCASAEPAPRRTCPADRPRPTTGCSNDWMSETWRPLP